MNILHMKYAIEIADAGSLGKAAENLSIAPPNLSRAIKELEDGLGVALFDRDAKGMALTPEGRDFIARSKKILRQIDGLEEMYKTSPPNLQKFSISVPRASYIAEAFVRFSKGLTSNPAEIYYRETNSYRAIKNILEGEYRLGIIRYRVSYEQYFQESLKEQGLASEVIAEFRYVLLMSGQNPLAAQEEIHFSDLRPLIEVAHADPFVPSLPLAAVKREELPDDVDRRILVFERGSQFDLLSENPQTFMWVSPVPDKLLRRYGLMQRECPDNERRYKDVLIHRRNYSLSDLDRKFIAEVRNAASHFLSL